MHFFSLLSMATDVSSVLISLVELLGGLGAFLIAVKIMSDTMNRLTNVGLRKLFQRLDNKRFLGVGLGALTSAVLHSSAITTVMVVGFVNSGVMALAEAVTIIMGANIGTTFTALVAALGTSFDFMAYATVLTLVGMMMCSIAKKDKWRNVGYMVAGLGLIFVSLQFMQAAVEPIKQSEEVRNFVASVTNPFLMLLVGMVLTFVLQSSTALTTILISMADVFCVSLGGNPSITNAAATSVHALLQSLLPSVQTPMQNERRFCTCCSTCSVRCCSLFCLHSGRTFRLSRSVRGCPANLHCKSPCSIQFSTQVAR